MSCGVLAFELESEPDCAPPGLSFGEFVLWGLPPPDRVEIVVAGDVRVVEVRAGSPSSRKRGALGGIDGATSSISVAPERRLPIASFMKLIKF